MLKGCVWHDSVRYVARSHCCSLAASIWPDANLRAWRVWRWDFPAIASVAWCNWLAGIAVGPGVGFGRLLGGGVEWLVQHSTAVVSSIAVLEMGAFLLLHKDMCQGYERRGLCVRSTAFREMGVFELIFEMVLSFCLFLSLEP